VRAGHASRTAEYDALFRALESSRPARERLFDDPLARAFVTWPLAAAAWLGPVPGLRDFVRWFIDKRWPGVRSSLVARTRLIDDAMTASADERMAQLVILGAGYDTRAYRLSSLREVTVFEVDHPDTQEAKLRLLRRALPAVPKNVRYVAGDFNQRQVESATAAAGYKETVPTIFLWEGVTNYLTEPVVDTTLRWCARAAAGSLLIFTYVHVDVLTDPGKFVGTDRLLATLANAGETFTFGFDPAELPEYLGDRGLSLERDIGAAEYRQLYYRDEARKMRGYEFYRVAVATVGGQTPNSFLRQQPG
jgi:methyltransferase (TIGR00027 family)